MSFPDRKRIEAANLESWAGPQKLYVPSPTQEKLPAIDEVDEEEYHATTPPQSKTTTPSTQKKLPAPKIDQLHDKV
ncbi:hypothetical protein [Simkania sp.]|uniref:hypothetical protein n=1 Tax=Simkania sp. TaxID=34094 RepID=UPI003B51C0B9